MNTKKVIPKIGLLEGDVLPGVVVPQLARLEAERVAEEKRQAEERAREAERLAALRATAGAD
jgi:hypothetical protein